MLDLSCFRSSRKWWPAAMFDESMPPGRADPQDWLKPDASGTTMVRDNDEPEGRALAVILPGAIAEFVWHEQRGSVEITLMPDGTWLLVDPRDDRTIDMFQPELQPTAPATLPPSAMIAASNWFAWDEDYETVADTMDVFASDLADMSAPIPADGVRITVDMGYWSEEVRFRVSADGKTLSSEADRRKA
ncbi:MULTISPECIES: hypothetical protein [unclassified Mesorhizobium]|uniref:hypothetical protein n=1 Tax=unclassified Mesorhizobium TaxID=325217 RepID=UPI001125C430|nr:MULTISPECIES: hypothetical protein [unclassified Mesorhizobium]MCA0027382.1 hypothetical protein [Mesorhizobium sp. B263B1A]TPJ98652.1 hypothetical protein FJ489_06925 [Mesorhizobium sp. B2-5-12]TPK28815.1 hypothetical protein FJ562_00315 [Mesorhizobium sp. B2-5-6]